MDKPTAIIYTSNTGHTRRYAELLAGRTGLPVYDLAGAALPAGSRIIYLGWLMAGKVQGLDKAQKRFDVAAVAGVGMSRTGTQVDDVLKANRIPEGTPVFTLQGGFDLSKLHGVYKLMMTAMKKTVGRTLAQKADRTPDEDDMLALLEGGGDRVDEAALTGLLDWLDNN